MSHYANTDWPEANAPEYPPEPAPVRLSIAESDRDVCWCIHATHTRDTFAFGSAPTLPAALQAAQEAAQRLGLREVADGYVSRPDAAYVPEASA